MIFFRRKNEGKNPSKISIFFAENLKTKFHRKKSISKLLIFSMNILKTKILKNIFKTFFRRDEKNCLVQIFFYCLDYVSRLQKSCSEYSGKLKHASAMDSVLKLSLKMIGYRWMFRRCSPIIYTCLPPEIHPHGQNAIIIREIINIIIKNSVMSQKTTK